MPKATNGASMCGQNGSRQRTNLRPRLELGGGGEDHRGRVGGYTRNYTNHSPSSSPRPQSLGVGVAENRSEPRSIRNGRTNDEGSRNWRSRGNRRKHSVNEEARERSASKKRVIRPEAHKGLLAGSQASRQFLLLSSSCVERLDTRKVLLRETGVSTGPRAAGGCRVTPCAPVHKVRQRELQAGCLHIVRGAGRRPGVAPHSGGTYRGNGGRVG